MILRIPVHLPRYAFSVRDVARAGHVWRAFQEVAVRGSAEVGWHPARYRTVGSAFIVREMRVQHRREAIYGEPVSARTWVADFRRGILTRREIRLDDQQGDLIAAASQEWVHVNARLRPVRAPAELLEAFPSDDVEPPVELPAVRAPEAGATEHRFAFQAWYVHMDPLGHANHPAYLDWCDEALARAWAGARGDPDGLRPIAESVRWKAGIEAPAEVEVTTRRLGRTAEGDVMCGHTITSNGEVAATATTVRRCLDRSNDALAEALA